MSHIAEIIAKRVKALRKERGWTQDTLAEKSNLSVDYLRKLETEKSWVSRESIEALSNAFQIPEVDLFRPHTVVRAPSKEEMLEAIVEDFDIDPKRKAMCKLALTAESELIDILHDRWLSSYIEAGVSGTPNNKKPSAG